MKNLIITCFVLFLSASINKINAQAETDTIPVRVIFYMPGITAIQLNDIKNTVVDIAEVTDALFISGTHNCLILDIDTSLGNDINYYYDLIKRFSPSYPVANLRIKDPSAFNEIFTNSPQSNMNILK
jgi:hypothetical protein